MPMPSRFKAAIISAAHRMRSKWYLIIPFALWELFKDRLANWANDKIDRSAGTVMKEVARLLEWAADQPLFWTLIFVVIVLVIVFLHSYITDEKPKRDVWLSDAMIYVLRGKWGDRFDAINSTENELSRLFEIEKEFRQAALDGKLPIWGKRAAYGLWEGVLAKDWASYELHEFDLLESLADPEKLMVFRKGDRFPTQEWVRVMTSKAKVKELWHASSSGNRL